MASAKAHFPISLAVATVGILPNIPESLSSKSLLVLTLIMIFGVIVDLDHISSLNPAKIKDGSWIREPTHVNWAHTWEIALLVLFISIRLWNFLPFISYVLHMIVDGPNLNNVRSPLPWGLFPYFPKFMRYAYRFRREGFKWQNK